MNKKVLTLCAAMLLTGSLSLSAASISFDDFKTQQGVEFSAGVMTFTEDVELESYQDYLLIDQDNITIEGNWHTLKGHIVVTGKNVTIKNLTVDYYNGAEESISFFDPTVTVNKTAISAYTEDITITGCIIKCSSKFWLANAISVFPKTDDAKILIQNNTIQNAKQKKDDTFSSAIIIAQGTPIGGLDGVTVPAAVVKNFDVSKAIVGNTFQECASDYTVADYSNSSVSYSAVQVAPLQNGANVSSMTDFLTNAAKDASITFKGDAADLMEVVGEVSNVNVAVVCDDGNVLFGTAENPDNGQGAVIAGIKPLNEKVFGYELMENATSDYCMLILHSNNAGKDYVIATGKDHLATELKAGNISEFANNPKALWKMTSGKDHDGKIWYQFKNQAGEDLTVNQKTTFFPKNNAAYNKGVVFKMDGFDLTTQNDNYFGLYAVGYNTLSVADLNWFEKDGFSVTIYHDSKDDDCFTTDHLATDIKGNPFQKHLTTMSWDATTKKFAAADDDATNFYLKDADGKYIVAEKYASNGSTASQNTYVFTAISETALSHELSTSEGKYFGKFKAEVSAKYTDMQKLSAIDILSVNVPTGWAEIGRLDLGTKEVPTLAASVSTDLKPILISLGSNKIVDAKKFLQKGKFYTVTLLGKNGGKLAVADDKYAGDVWTENAFVHAYGNLLEGQFALTYQNGSFVFTNREYTNYYYTIPANQLYYGEGENEYVYGNNTYVIETVKEHAATDGYKKLEDVKNNKFYIGYASGVYGNAWLTENHEGTSNHTIGLDVDQENALTFTATEYAAERAIKHDKNTHTDTYCPTDSIYVISTLGYFEGNTYKTTKDTLKVVSYSFVNQWNEPLTYSEEGSSSRYVSQVYKNPSKKQRFESVAEAAPYAEKFALRIDNGKLNLRPVVYDGSNYSTWIESSEFEYSYTHQTFGRNEKVYAGDAAVGILDNEYLYNRTENDLFVVEPTEKAMYRRVVSPLDTISIYRNDNNKSVLFESKGFLGMENLSQFPDIAPGMVADTAYIGNGDETYYRPQYMLVVNPDITPAGRYCPIHGDDPTCPDAHKIDTKGWVEGRYLVNLVDTAIAWDIKNKHKDNNPYINSEKYYRLGFVQAKHYNDSLIVASTNDTLFVGGEDFNQAKFAFRYVDQAAGSFVIETANYKRLPNATKAVRNGEGYIKWMNGVVVVVDDIKNADVFNMTEGFEGDPTANEEISTSSVVVAGVNGAVVVKGAEGKNVIVSTILGKVVANEVVSSDNATIAAPQGVVVVSVDGESFKVVVK